MYINNTRLSSGGATALLKALKDNGTLKDLDIVGYDITDDVCDAIITALDV